MQLRARDSLALLASSEGINDDLSLLTMDLQELQQQLETETDDKASLAAQCQELSLQLKSCGELQQHLKTEQEDKGSLAAALQNELKNCQELQQQLEKATDDKASLTAHCEALHQQLKNHSAQVTQCAELQQQLEKAIDEKALLAAHISRLAAISGSRCIVPMTLAGAAAEGREGGRGGGDKSKNFSPGAEAAKGSDYVTAFRPFTPPVEESALRSSTPPVEQERERERDEHADNHAHFVGALSNADVNHDHHIDVVASVERFVALEERMRELVRVEEEVDGLRHKVASHVAFQISIPVTDEVITVTVIQQIRGAAYDVATTRPRYICICVCIMYVYMYILVHTSDPFVV